MFRKVQKKKHNVRQRESGWKKKKKKVKVIKSPKKSKQSDLAKKLREKIKKMQNRRKTVKSVSEVNRAKQISKRLHSIQAIVKKSHLTRLDTLLASNELRRSDTYGDGNCFFTSVKVSGKLTESAFSLREKVCNYMTANADKYMSFLTTSDVNSKDTFLRDIDLLKTNGKWNMEIADIVPLAVANIMESTIRIYSSSVTTPVIEIKPEQTTEKVVCLAYLAVRGHEHYDATKSLSCNDNISETNQVNKSSSRAEYVSDSSENERLGPTEDTETTPHKRAPYRSPEKKHSSRKRKRDIDNWKRNVRKALKNKGKEYLSAHGKRIEAKQVQVQNCDKCRFKCSSKFTEEQREEIFTMYYSLGSYERQRQFICEMVERGTPSRKGKGKKTVSQKFFLEYNSRKERVCRNFFTKTLDIKRKTIDYTLSKKKHGAYAESDKRGKSSSANKLNPERVALVKKHIESFPTMESHYKRKTSRKDYLSHELNIKKMWELYSKECERKGTSAVSHAMYRKIFCENYNISFYKPKKDQCSLCTLFERRKQTGTIDDVLQAEYDEHQKQKQRAREEKSKDKDRAKADKSIYVATFDLQAVLTTPCSLVSELYYSRKLCCYNLTLYSLADRQVVCHVWDETNGKRGSCEIATCLMKNTFSVSKSSVKEIVYYSDTCGGQNRNQFVTASLLYTLFQCPNLNKISHKFLVSGHSQMECDSVHSTIEGAKKITPVFVPSQWCTLISLARKSHPYIAVPMKYNHVVDFKDFVKKHCPNLRVTVSGERINWLQVKWIEVRKENPKSVFVNYSFDTEGFQEINIERTTRKKGRLYNWPENEKELSMCYETKLPISLKKKSDLVALCSKEIIPEEFHSYYEGLPSSKKERDFVPMESSDEDTDIE